MEQTVNEDLERSPSIRKSHKSKKKETYTNKRNQTPTPHPSNRNSFHSDTTSPDLPKLDLPQGLPQEEIENLALSPIPKEGRKTPKRSTSDTQLAVNNNEKETNRTPTPSFFILSQPEGQSPMIIKRTHTFAGKASTSSPHAQRHNSHSAQSSPKTNREAITRSSPEHIKLSKSKSKIKVPKTQKQKFDQLIKKADSIGIFIVDKKLRNKFSKGLVKKKKNVLNFLCQRKIINELVENLLCLELSMNSAVLCHWSTIFLLTSCDTLLDIMCDINEGLLEKLCLILSTQIHTKTRTSYSHVVLDLAPPVIIERDAPKEENKLTQSDPLQEPSDPSEESSGETPTDTAPIGIEDYLHELNNGKVEDEILFKHLEKQVFEISGDIIQNGDRSYLPDNMKYFFILMRHLLKCRPKTILDFLSKKDEQFSNTLVEYFQYSPVAYLCFEILLAEEDLSKQIGKDYNFWYKKSKIYKQLRETLERQPLLYCNSIRKFATVLSKFHAPLLHKSLAKYWIPKILPTLTTLLCEAECSTDAKSIVSSVLRCAEIHPDTVKSCLEHLNNQSLQFKEILCSDSPLVILNTLVLLTKLQAKYKNIFILKENMKEILDLLLTDNGRQIIQSKVLAILEMIFNLSDNGELCDIIFRQNKLLDRVKSQIEKHTSKIPLRKLLKLIPQSEKNDDWLLLEKNLNEGVPVVSNIYLVSKKLRLKYTQNVQITDN
eukprot:TRINITY_DN4215_c0_g1_i1.p1 TRINITY_DN4215_c0_g1~~TRINITY_DN4215_c0_g1_i1.p1  ORF type:complete len:715 (+),score=137.73 TRINITY_DN4215_c0_g1_i1:29-2173(+)